MPEERPAAVERLSSGAVIIDAPPGGPRGVKRVFIGPGVGATPYDQRRYFCSVCRDFAGATGEKGDICTVDPKHPLRGKKKRGRPSPWGFRHNRVRSIYADYLSQRGYVRFIMWWCRHAPKDYAERIQIRESYSLTRIFSDRVKWDPKEPPAELAIALLARRLRKTKAAVRQLIKEGAWWDRVEEQSGVEGIQTIRAMTRDAYQAVLEDGRLLLGSRGGRLTPAQAQSLLSRLPPALDAATMRTIEAAIEEYWRRIRGDSR